MGHRLVVRTSIDVEISAQSREIVKRLSENPYDLFRRPYLGYMIVLFSDVDAAAQSWIRQYARTLDSLTGADVGFLLLGARIPLEVTGVTQTRVRSARPPRPYSARVPDPEVADLVKFGKLQFEDLPEHPEGPFVVNETVYAIARELGLTQHLPCIVAFDGLPQPDLPRLCVPIREEHLPRLFPAIQSAVGALQQAPDVDRYRASLVALAEEAEGLTTAREDAFVVRRTLEARRLREGRVAERMRAGYDTLYQAFREAIQLGQRRRLPVVLAELRRRHPGVRVEESRLSAIPWEELTRFRKTIHMLGLYGSRPWPLEAEAMARVAAIYRRHVLALAGGLPADPVWHSAADVEFVCRRLVELWRQRVAECVAALPAPAEAGFAGTPADERELDALREEIGRLGAQLADAEEQIASREWRLVQATHRISGPGDRPSFCAALRAHCACAGIPTEPAGRGAQGAGRGPSFWSSWVPVRDLLGWIGSRSFTRLPAIPRGRASEVAEPHWQRPPTAFASYASADRVEVIRRVQGMRAWQPGLDVFLDFHSLFPGERWRERLEQEIRQRDRFLLFWSDAARNSEYVDFEWRTALKCHGPEAITPVPLQPPDQVPPPRELSDLHFNDLYVEMLRYARGVPPEAR